MMRGAASLACLLALSTACRTSSTPAPEPAPEPARDAAHARVRVVMADGKSPAFAADADAILAELEAWRGLAFEHDLLVELVAPEDVDDDKLNGWYEPSTKRLVVVEGNTERMGRGTLLHEMFHALQDQHFDLARLHREVDGMGTDAERALAALIEGEAMLAVSELMSYDFEQHAHLPEAGPVDPKRFEKIFHYGAGLRYVRALRDAGGWAKVDAAFAAPPRTTMDILHLDWLAPGYVAPLESPMLPPSNAGGAPRGLYELALFLAVPEETRAASAGAALHMLQEHAWHEENGELVWRILFDDTDAARLAVSAAELQGGRAQSAIAMKGGLVTLYLKD